MDPETLTSDSSSKTMMKLKKVKKLDPKIIMEQFKKGMPGHIVWSVISRYHNKGLLLSSSAFLPKLDPKTLVYEDMMLSPPPPATMKEVDKESYPPFKLTVPLLSVELNF